jgi:biotin transport system ATP-binding protein
LQVDGHISPGQTRRIRRAAGLVLQDADLQIIGATVGEDLRLGLDGDDSLVDGLAGRFGLDGLMDRPVQTLSHGQKRKLTLAAALAARPRVLLMDEPFSGLDWPGARELRGIVAENRAAGLTQVISTHDVGPIADLADLWFVLDGGRLTLSGEAGEVFARLGEHGVRPPGSAWGEGG